MNNGNEKYQELIEYHKKHHHCNVEPTDATLYRWLKRQRYLYRAKCEGKPSPISEERIKALERLGINWNPQETLWLERFTELQHYKNVNGHCNVPSKYPPKRTTEHMG